MIRNLIKFVLFHGFLVANIACQMSIPQFFQMTTPDKIRKEGYRAEEHSVTTEDGYMLTLHRIPGKSGSPAIFVQHGMFSNSFDWVVMGKNKSLAFILADNGYDVWLGNTRGNTYSRRHLRLQPSNPKFWDFSFHEMGIYDLPAVISYISELKNDTIFYVGHSMGTTMSYIMATERPDIAKKVKVIFSFSPAAYIRYWNSPIRILFDIKFDVESVITSLRLTELLSQNFITRTFLTLYCNNLSPSNICLQVIFAVFGRNPSQFDYNLVPMIFSHTPAGASWKAVLHYLQMSKTGKFQHYDYRSPGNQLRYNSSQPPEYNITNINVPIGLFWSDNDLVIHPQDVKILYDALPKKAMMSYRVSDPLFTHLDFMWAKNAHEMVYSKLLSVMKEYL